jgi:hypothetical protein
MKKVYVLLEPNGDVKFLVKNKMMSLWDMCNLIDCRMIDESDVQINFPFKSTILFDDEFGLKRNNKMNLLASVLYGYTTNHMQTLYGNVILQKRIDCVTGDILWGYTYKEANVIKKRIREIKKDYRYKFLSNLIK